MFSNTRRKTIMKDISLDRLVVVLSCSFSFFSEDIEAEGEESRAVCVCPARLAASPPSFDRLLLLVWAVLSSRPLRGDGSSSD